jgi:photosystem II stability/assembly factor-like uncharacterized protein
MKKSVSVLLLLAAALFVGSIFIFMQSTFSLNNTELARGENEHEEEGEEEYENLEDRYRQEFEMQKDPALGYIPTDGLVRASEETRKMKSMLSTSRIQQSLTWEERGPIYDLVGPSNGNGRGGASRAAGVLQTFLLDTIGDPTGNTILAGTPSGGLWRCTNLLSSSAPNWQPVNDFMANLCIASICRNPASPNIMYLATGDANSRTVPGNGIWKSIDNGVTWNLLSSTVNYTSSFKILCDASGNVYVATGGSGLLRSTNGGTSWSLISPSDLTVSNPGYVPDLEISANGRLHACFGYYGTTAKHYYTTNPATVSQASGWNTSTGIRLGTTTNTRIELATKGNLMYAITVNGSYNMDSCYKSIDDGATWTKQNTSAYTSSLGSTQGWYAITLQIDPDNDNAFIVGGLDAFRSTNSGLTISKITYWAGSSPYVHADHHFMQWYKQGEQSKVLIGSDGGLFMSTDGGATWRDRNENMATKQFYSCAIHPTTTNFLMAGAQDNGCHQITTAGKTYSTEVTGGDGAYVHINQQNPLIQFGSYIYNRYRRSTNGGTSWSSVDLSTSAGFFINPFDYDDANNIMYASNAGSSANNQVRRWDNASTGSTSTVITLSELTRNATSSNSSAFKVSPFTANRVYIGSNNGSLIRLDNASTVTTATESANVTNLTSGSFPAGYLNCINFGSTEQNMVAVFTNYGVNNIWVSSDGGSSWTAIDGNLPNMPVRWAVFDPFSNNRMIIATETGIFTTDAINGAATSWTPNPGFPTVRTTMLKMRPTDNTIVASTFGRGLWTAVIPAPLPVTLSSFEGSLVNKSALLKWTTATEQNTKSFEVEKSVDRVNFYNIGSVRAAGASTTRKDYSLTDQRLGDNNYYRLKVVDVDGQFKYSQVVLIKFNQSKQNVWVVSNPIKDNIGVGFAKQGNQAKLQLINLNGAVIAEKTVTNPSGQISWALPRSISAGSYILRSVVDGELFTTKVVKQ